ncbi:NUDIX hydrolase [soil metagenome]
MGQVREWKYVESEVVADFDVFCVRRHVARSPRTGDVHEFHVLDVPTCVVVIPFTDDGRVVMVEQYRHAARRVSLEFPAGLVERGEGAVAAALRELEEETGFCAGRAERVGEFDPDPALQSNAIEVVVAQACSASGERCQDAGEDVEVRLVGANEIDGLIRSGEIRGAPAISAWLLYTGSTATD